LSIGPQAFAAQLVRGVQQVWVARLQIWVPAHLQLMVLPQPSGTSMPQVSLSGPHVGVQQVWLVVQIWSPAHRQFTVPPQPSETSIPQVLSSGPQVGVQQASW